MSTAEIKSNLHKFIVETDDINILQKAQEFFLALRKNSISGESLSDAEKKMIALGLKDIEEGNVISNEEVKHQFKNWVNEKGK